MANNKNRGQISRSLERKFPRIAIYSHSLDDRIDSIFIVKEDLKFDPFSFDGILFLCHTSPCITVYQT